MIRSMKPTGVDRFSASPAVRVVVVLGWFIITAMAFMSRYERFTPVLATLMGTLIIGIASLGMIWALLPAFKGKERRSKLR